MRKTDYRFVLQSSSLVRKIQCIDLDVVNLQDHSSDRKAGFCVCVLGSGKNSTSRVRSASEVLIILVIYVREDCVEQDR